jgi:hypothetical protein
MAQVVQAGADLSGGFYCGRYGACGDRAKWNWRSSAAAPLFLREIGYRGFRGAREWSLSGAEMTEREMDPTKDVLNAQRQFWDTNFATRPEMFGDASSDPAQRALELLKLESRTSLLYCMPITNAEVERLSQEIRRVLKPGGMNVFTVRHTHFGTGIHRGEEMYEVGGFIVNFFDRAKVERVSQGYELLSVDEFEEGGMPRKLFRVTLRKPAPK